MYCDCRGRWPFSALHLESVSAHVPTVPSSNSYLEAITDLLLYTTCLDELFVWRYSSAHHCCTELYILGPSVCAGSLESFFSPLISNQQGILARNTD